MAKIEIFLGMSEQAIRQRVVEEAQKYLGVVEGTIEHKRIVDIYNSQRNLPRGYRLQYDDAWCAAFMSFIGIQLGISDIILPECGCAPMIELYKAIGRWEERDNYVPDLADIVMYDWDAKSGACTGSPDHVGMVVSVNGKTIRVIEGNYQNKVQYRDICVEYVKTRGFCLPDYASLVQHYTDVPNDIWYAREIAKATELGIVNGVGNGEFAPELFTTRAESAAIAVRVVEVAVRLAIEEMKKGQ